VIKALFMKDIRRGSFFSDIEWFWQGKAKNKAGRR